MRKRLLVLIIGILFAFTTQAQLVLTVAGQLDSIGNQDGPPFEAIFNNPHGIAVDCLGNIYVADRFGHVIRKILPDGTVITLAGQHGVTGATDAQGTNATFNEPWGLCADSIGNVYVADTRNNKIRKIDVTGNVTTFAGTGNFGVSNGPAAVSTFGNPTGIEIDDNGVVYVADHLTHIIRKIDPSGNVTTLAGTPFIADYADGIGTQARFNRPYGLEIDNDGNIIVADEWNHRIRRVTPTGIVTTIAGSGVVGSTDGASGVASFNYPWDVAVDSAGNMFVGDGYNDVIRKITPNGDVSTYVGTAGNSGALDATGPIATFNATTGIAYLKTTDELYVADAFNNLIRKIVNLNQQSVSLQLTSGQSTTICEGETVSFRAIPEIYDSYDFYIDGTLVQSSTDEFFSTNTLAPGNYFFQVIANDGADQITSGSVFISIIPAPDASITAVGPTTFFNGDSVTLISSSGTSYLWSTGATTATITVFTGGSYWVDVTNTNGCAGRSDTVIVDVTQFSEDPEIIITEGPISISANGDQGTLCYGTSANLLSDYAQNNQWLKDGFPIDSATGVNYIATEPGEYQVQVVDTLGFTLQSNIIRIIVLPKQIEDFTAAPLGPDVGESVQFTPTVSDDVTNYFWDFGEPDSGIDNFSNDRSPTHAYAERGLYTVTLITSDVVGCSDTLAKADYIDVGGGNNIGPDDGPLFVPSAFTPNGDNLNDILYVRGANIAGLELSIYNQWGERIFFSDDQSFGWDGTYDGRFVQLGTYVYVAIVNLTDGSTETLKGHVTILK